MNYIKTPQQINYDKRRQAIDKVRKELEEKGILKIKEKKL